MLHAKLSLARRGPSTHEPPRVHHAARRRGGSVAARGARAAGEEPVIGFLSGGSHEASSQVIRMLKQSLAEVGFDERNVAFEYRYAEGKYDRLAVIAAELVRRPVSLIVASTTPPALAAKAATSAIPIVFGATDDPVRVGLVASLARPGGNATGVFFLSLGFGSETTRLGAGACSKCCTHWAFDQPKP